MFFDETAKQDKEWHLRPNDTLDGIEEPSTDDTTDNTPSEQGGYLSEAGVSPRIIDELSEPEDGNLPPGFNQGGGEAQPPEQHQPSVLNRYAHPTREPGKTEKWLRDKKEKLAERQARQVVAKQAAKTVVARGAGAVAGVATGGLSLAVTAALAGVQFYDKHPTFQKIAFFLLLFLVGTGVFFGIVGIVMLIPPSLPGANHLGGTRPQPEDDFYAPAAAAQASGLILGNSIEALDIATNKIEALLNNNPPRDAKVDAAKKKLQEIKEFQKTLKAGAFSAKHEEYATKLNQYKQHIRQLYALLYPGRTVAQAEVQRLIGAKKIQLQTSGVCRPDRDLKGMGVTENMFNVLAAVGNHTNITVTCMITGHRKYVGRAPSDGFPRCGSPSTFGSERASQSLHCLGRAVDLAPNGAAEQFLRQNASRLRIKLVLDEGNHLHIEVRE